MTSSGVFIQPRIVGAKTTPITIRIAPPAMDMAMPVCTVLLTRSLSPLPQNCAMMTVAPEDRPTKKPTSRLISVPAVPPTAAKASVPTYWPTTTASTVLYICWKKVPSRMGKKKYRSCFQITPSVMPLTAAISLFLIESSLYFSDKNSGPVFGPHLF